MNAETEARVRPCRHMEASIAALADESLKGPAKWYAQFHVAGCGRCSQTLAMFQLLKFRLASFASAASQSSDTLPEDRRSSIDAALDAMDRNQERR